MYDTYYVMNTIGICEEGLSQAEAHWPYGRLLNTK